MSKEKTIGTNTKRTLLGFYKDSDGNKWPLPIGWKTFYVTAVVALGLSVLIIAIGGKGIGTMAGLAGIFALAMDGGVRKDLKESHPNLKLDKYVEYIRETPDAELKIKNAKKADVIKFYFIWIIFGFVISIFYNLL